MAAAAEFLERWNSAAGERNEAEEDALIFAEQRIPEQLASPRSTSAHTLKEWLTRADDAMNKHLNEYTALLKKKKAFCVEQLKTLDKFLLLCRRMQIRCEGLLQADAFRQLSTGEADDAVRLPEEEEFSLGLLQISATLLKDRITGTEASLRAVQVGANHFCEKMDTAYGHDWPHGRMPSGTQPTEQRSSWSHPSSLAASAPRCGRRNPSITTPSLRQTR